jgi:hypothetical protein
LGLDGAKDDCRYAGIGCANRALRLSGRKASEDSGLSSAGQHGGDVIRRGSGSVQRARSGQPTHDAFPPPGTEGLDWYLRIHEPLARLAIGFGAIGAGAYVGAAGVVATGAAVAAAPATGLTSLILVPGGVLVTAGGVGLVTFGTTVVLNEVNGAITSINSTFNTNIGTIPTLFPSIAHYRRR